MEVPINSNICECGCGQIVKRRFAMHHNVRCFSEETKAKMRLSAKGCPHQKGGRLSENHKKKLSESHMGQRAWNKGIPMTEEQKKVQSMRMLGKPAWNKGTALSSEHKGKLSTANKGRPSWNKGKAQSEEARRVNSESHKGILSPLKGKKLSQSHIDKMLATKTANGSFKCSEELREKRARLWKTAEYVQHQMAARNVSQNKKEKELQAFLDNMYPGEWKFVGDGQVIIEGKCPDFINVNGQKKIIELFGDYWHMGQNPQDRIDVFESFGFKTLVVWEKELKDGAELATTIRNFSDTNWRRITLGSAY